jgi:flagellar hook-length control protein FliK
MLDFMDSFESEFGISPEEIVGAMSKLTPAELQSPPELTADKVISQLNLTEEQKPEAELLYAEFLVQWRQLQPQENQKLGQQAPQIQSEAKVDFTPAASILVAGAAAKAQQLQGKKVLNQNIEQMSQKFFLQDFKKGGLSALQQTQELNPAVSLKGLDQVENRLTLAELTQSQQPKDLSHVNLNVPERPELNVDAHTDPVMQDLAIELAQLSDVAAKTEQHLRNDPQNEVALRLEKAMQALGFGIGSAAMGSELSDQGASFSGESSQQGFGSDSAAASTKGFEPGQMIDIRALQFREALSGMTKSTAPLAVGMEGTTQTMNAKTSDTQPIIQQAQYLATHGGGEASIQMNTEGMGQVHLKVSVNDGKVNVEIGADSKEAKNMIEGTLDELRANLGAHKLSVESIKVDVGNQLSSDSGSKDQMSQQLQGEADRDQTKRFFGDFTNDFGARSRFFETPETKFFNRGQRVDPLQPQMTAQSAMKRYTSQGKGQGLDTVA